VSSGHQDHESPEDVHDVHENEDSHDHDEVVYIDVSDTGISMAGIQIAAVGKQRISNVVVLPGEIGFNEDRLAHITPRYGGVVKDVRKRMGNLVDEGETLAVIESNQSLTAYKIRAPLAGHVVRKHATPGEYVSEETSIFVIADLSSVWVNLDVYPRHLESVSVGSKATIKAVSVNQEGDGIISYVAPLFDRAKRAAVARIILPNDGQSWRPGMFVRAELEIASLDSVVAVEKEAVQVIEDETHVFVPVGPNRFQPVEVVVGNSGKKYIQILSGLSPGDSYVARGAFHLKAEMITGSLGGHAGHGH
jgi:cobalt-zinc-cadmium efflux system membrane fusion protein